MTTGRSNAKTDVTFTNAAGTIVTDRIHGDGFGAFCKMADRAVVACTDWTPAATKIDFDGETVTFTHRASGETSSWAFSEAIRGA